MSTTTMYLQNVTGAVRAGDGVRLARLFSLRYSPANKLKPLDLQRVEQSFCSSFVEPPLNITAYSHLKALGNKDNAQLAFQAQRDALKSFKEFAASVEDANWILPALEQLTLDLRLLATQVDEETAGTAEKREALEATISDLRECFVLVSSDRASLDNSKKWGTMFLINQMFCIAFKLNNFAIVESFRRAMTKESQMMPYFHLSHRVTYAYHVGRVALFNSQYDVAEKELTEAFKHCLARSFKNKRLILIHLIPVNILRGKLPSPQLLSKYELPQFVDIVQSMRVGNIALFKEALAKHQSFFVQCGVFLILEKATLLVFRRLLKRILFSDRTVQETEVELDEVECSIANLIQLKLVKGYLSHDKRVLVLSKKDPFPPISSQSSQL